jgi:anti-anti-sigma factor
MREQTMQFSGRKISAEVSAGHMSVRFRSAVILDPGDVSGIAKDIQTAIEKYRVQLVVLNLTGVKQLSSQMFGQMLHLRKYMMDRKGELRLCCMTDGVLKAFKLCRFDKLIKHYDTEDAAVTDGRK